MSQKVLYFLHSTSVLSFHISVLTRSTIDFDEITDDLTFLSMSHTNR